MISFRVEKTFKIILLHKSYYVRFSDRTLSWILKYSRVAPKLTDVMPHFSDHFFVKTCLFMFYDELKYYLFE